MVRIACSGVSTFQSDVRDLEGYLGRGGEVAHISLIFCSVLLATFFSTPIALAEDPYTEPSASHVKKPAQGEDERGTYVHVLGTAALGTGLRFNNPYRLATPLGSTPESVSLSARYLDLGLAATFYRAGRFQHGAHVHGSFALSGISQSVVALSYIGLYQPNPTWLGYARAGVPFVLTPDGNVGGELAAGAVLHVLSGVGLTAEVGGTGFYGAATREVSATFIPILFGQVGVALDLELLR